MAESDNETMAIVQAHARGWDGSLDHSLVPVDGRPAICHALERLLATPGISPERCCIAVPDDPLNDAYEAIAEEAGVRLVRGAAHDVALRFLQAARCVGASRVLHVMGQHMFVIPELLAKLLDRQAAGGFDLVQAPIHFETHFTGHCFRVDALRRAREEILAGPESDRPRLLARPLSFLANASEGYATHVLDVAEIPRPTDDALRSFRSRARQMFAGTERSQLDRSQAFQPGNYNAQRYETVLSLIGGNDVVLDAACGDGSGAERLASRAARVVGVDLDPDVVWANRDRCHGRIANLAFESADVCAMPFDDDAFSAIVSLETIEHVEDPEAYCEEMKRVLAPGGRLFCSTPQNLWGRIPINPWHLREFSLEEFRALLERHFDDVVIRGAVNGVLTNGEVGNNMIAFARSPQPAERVVLESPSKARSGRATRPLEGPRAPAPPGA